MYSENTLINSKEKNLFSKDFIRVGMMLTFLLILFLFLNLYPLVYAQESDIALSGVTTDGKLDDIDPVNTGQNFSYTLRVINYGPSDATGVVVKDWVPEGLRIINVTYISQGAVNIGVPGDPLRPLVWNIGNVSVAKSLALVYKVTVLEPNDPSTQTWVIHNDAMVTSETHDPKLTNNLFSEDTTIIHIATADLKIESGGGSYPGKNETIDPVNPGQTFLYNVRVANYGPANATNVILKDWVPAGLIINNATTSRGSVNIGVPGDPLRPLVWVIGKMGVIETCVLTYNVTVLKPHDLSLQSWILHNDVIVTSDLYDPDTSNNYYTEDTTVINNYFESDLRVIKLSKPDDVAQVDQLVNYTIIIENRGPGTAHDVEFRDELRASGVFKVVNINSISGGAYAFSILPPKEGRTVSFTGTRNDSTMEHGERDIIQVTVQANKTMDINNLVNVYCEDINHWLDPDMSNNEAYTPISVEGTSILSVIGGIITPATLPYIVVGYLIVMSLTILLRGRIQQFLARNNNSG